VGVSRHVGNHLAHIGCHVVKCASLEDQRCRKTVGQDRHVIHLLRPRTQLAVEDCQLLPLLRYLTTCAGKPARGGSHNFGDMGGCRRCCGRARSPIGQGTRSAGTRRRSGARARRRTDRRGWKRRNTIRRRRRAPGRGPTTSQDEDHESRACAVARTCHSHVMNDRKARSATRSADVWRPAAPRRERTWRCTAATFRAAALLVAG